MSSFYDLSKTPRNILNQAIVRAIISENNGAWFDPEDLSTMFQDAAGTTPVTALEQPVGRWLDKSGNGNHATQSITASRPTLSARYNLLTKTEDFSDGVWVKTGCTVSATEGPSGNAGAFRITEDASTGKHMLSQPITVAASKVFTVLVKDDGAGYCVISWRGNSDIRYDAIRYDLTTATKIFVQNASGYYLSDTINILSDGLIEITITLSAASNFIIACANPVKDPDRWVTYAGDGVSGIKVYHPTVNSGLTSKPYQRVNTATDYDTVGFKKYIKFDGVDDYLNIPYMGLYANGSASIVAARDALSQTADTYVISERSTSNVNPKYFPSRQLANAGNMDSYIVNDAAAVVVDTVGSAYGGASDAVVRSAIDSGNNIKLFKNGALAANDNYTRSGTLTLNTTTIGASVSTTTSNYANMKLYGLCIAKSALSDLERRRVEWLLAYNSGVQI